MKTEHEQLKEIIETIDFSGGGPIAIIWNETDKVWERINYKKPGICDVREIVFRDNFIKKIYDYVDNTPGTGIMLYDIRLMESRLMENLDNPVTYLYDLLNLGN